MPREIIQPDPSREVSLLVGCVREFLAGKPDAAIGGVSRPDINWPAFAALCDHHRLTGIIHASLSAWHADLPPDAVLRQMQSACQANARRALLLTGRLIEIVELLQIANIPAIPFKGPLLAAEIYGDVALRGAGDLDLLIHHHDIVPARQALIARGFKPIFPNTTPRQSKYLSSLAGRRLEAYLRSHAEHHFLSPDSAVNVDLHWSITLYELGLKIDCRPLWENARPIALAGRFVNTLSPEDLLLVLSINGAKDGWPRLDRVCDVATLLTRRPSMDWPRLIAQAHSARAARILLLSTALANQIFNVPLPEILARRIGSDRALPRLCLSMRQNLLNPAVFPPREQSVLSAVLFQLRARDGMSNRLRYSVRQLHPTVGDWAAFPLPRSLNFLYYLLRPFRLIIGRLF